MQPSVESSHVWNVPNTLSALRLLLAFGLFVLIEQRLFVGATLLFLVAASTDWIDGWWARRFGQITRLGRIFDPLVDKVIVCGAFILLADRGNGSAIAAWMAVVVVVRELIVTAVRAEMERSGRDFSAGLSGKLKMVLQCAAIGLELMARAQPDAALGGTSVRQMAWIAAWAAVVVTAYSGVDYLCVARGILTSSSPTRNA